MPELTEVTVNLDSRTGVFGTLTFEKAGVYEYVITEKRGDIKDLIYDKTEHKVVVTVIQDEETNALTATVTYDGGEKLTIVNETNIPTGDTAPLGLWSLICAVSLAGFALVTAEKKRKAADK